MKHPIISMIPLLCPVAFVTSALGATPLDLGVELAEQRGRLVLSAVHPGSPLEPFSKDGDQLLGIDDIPMRSKAAVESFLARLRPHDAIIVHVATSSGELKRAVVVGDASEATTGAPRHNLIAIAADRASGEQSSAALGSPSSSPVVPLSSPAPAPVVSATPSSVRAEAHATDPVSVSTASEAPSPASGDSHFILAAGMPQGKTTALGVGIARLDDHTLVDIRLSHRLDENVAFDASILTNVTLNDATLGVRFSQALSSALTVACRIGLGELHVLDYIDVVLGGITLDAMATLGNGNVAFTLGVDSTFYAFMLVDGDAEFMNVGQAVKPYIGLDVDAGAGVGLYARLGVDAFLIDGEDVDTSARGTIGIAW